MACGCSTYTCIEAWVNPCSEGVELPIEATVTDNITVNVEFNGIWAQASVFATEGEDIILPIALFNENYTHEMRLVMDDVETCYKVRTALRLDSGEFIPTPPVGGDVEGITVTIETVSEDGFTFTSDDITGTVVAIITDQQGLNGAQFTQVGTSVTRTDAGSWYVGQIITIFMI
jgi:hypothetical protein